MSHKVSIIVPIYNVSKYIKRCAISLFEQTYSDIEYIFVNDCTLDNSMDVLSDIIRLYPTREPSITILKHPINKGLAAARNTGFKAAHGEYILNIDSDDYIEFDMVDCMVKKAVETDSDIVVCDHLLQWNKVSCYCFQNYAEDNVTYTKMLLSFDVTPNVWNKMIKRSLYVNNGVCSVEGVDTGEDYQLIPRLAYFATSIAKVDLPFYHYIQTNRSSYMKNYSHKSIISLIKVLDILKDFFEEKDDKEVYQDALLRGRLKFKILMIKVSSYNERPWIASLYPETDSLISKIDISIQGRITLFLAKKKLFLFLGIFLFVQRFISEVSEAVKGRKF